MDTFLAPCVCFSFFFVVYSFTWHRKHQHSTNADPAENALSGHLSLSLPLSPTQLHLSQIHTAFCYLGWGLQAVTSLISPGGKKEKNAWTPKSLWPRISQCICNAQMNSFYVWFVALFPSVNIGLIDPSTNQVLGYLLKGRLCPRHPPTQQVCFFW